VTKVGSDWLSRTLSQLRKDAGISSQTAAGEQAGLSQSRMSRLETGRYALKVAEAVALCRLYGAPPGTTERVIQAARDLEAGHTRSRVVLRRGGHAIQERIARIEEVSAHIRVFQPVIFPGLIQSEGYARGVFASRGDPDSATLAQAVTQRIERAQILSSDREITLINAEGALWWPGVGPEVMAAQLEHMIAVTLAWPQVRYGIITRASRAGVFPTHGFSVYDEREVIVGLWGGTTFSPDVRDVEDHLELFARLEAIAVFGAGARDLLRRAAAEYRTLI
jgi:DNA-binding XRE family transcriptional regulator